MPSPWSILNPADTKQALSILGGSRRKPDLTIAPDGQPYLYRWYVVPRHEADANVYLHLQIASDPERPLHDHPWDNVSVILSGGYVELLTDQPQHRLPARQYNRKAGDVVYRTAETAHRLFLPPKTPYTLTLFTTGPVRRDWGFWTKTGWRNSDELVKQLPDGRSIFLGELE